MPRVKLSAVKNWTALAEQARYDYIALAKSLGVSLRCLERFFHAQALRSPREWLNELRLWKAAEGLVTGQKGEALAIELGYCDSSHFRHWFRRYFKCTPTEFRAIWRRNRASWKARRDPAAPQYPPVAHPWTEAIRALEAQLRSRPT